MAKIMAGNSSGDKTEINCRYEIGQTLYLESPDRKEIIEFEVAELKLQKKSGTIQKLYGLVTSDPKYGKDHSMRYLSESDIEKYHAKNTELLNEMKGQMTASVYRTGEQRASVQLDNGRQVSINESKDGKGNLKVSLYANSDEIQKGIFYEKSHVIEQYIGPDKVDFLYKALKNILEINDHIKTPNSVNQPNKRDNFETFRDAFSYVVGKDQNSRYMIITNEAGESIKLNGMEFWEIVKVGNQRDIQNEIDEVLFDTSYIDGLPVYLLAENKKALDMVAQKVDEIRTGRETNEQVYEAFHKLQPELYDMLRKELLYAIDRCIDFEETYFGINGYELRNSSAAKEMIVEYIFNHELEPGDSVSEHIHEAIQACQKELKAGIVKTRKESLEEKIKGTESRTEKLSDSPYVKTIDNSRER